MRYAQPCDMPDIIHIEDTKYYTIFANCLIERLTNAVQRKLIKPLSMCIWVHLKSEVHLRSKEWSITKSISEIAKRYGISKTTAKSYLRELESNGYLNILRSKKDEVTNNINTIEVRFPMSEINDAKEEKNRSKNEQKLSTGVGRNLDGGWGEIPTPLNTNNIILINNNKEEESVDCCHATHEEENVPQPIVPRVTNVTNVSQECCDTGECDECGENCPFEECPFEDEECPYRDDIKQTSLFIEKLEEQEKILIAKRKSNPMDLEAYQMWGQCDSSIESSKVILRNLLAKKDRFKRKSCDEIPEPTEKPEIKSDYRRENPIKLSNEQTSRIKSQLRRMHKEKLISNPDQLFNQIKFQLINYSVGSSIEHGINICMKLIRENRYRTPAGYQDYSLIERDINSEKNRDEYMTAPDISLLSIPPVCISNNNSVRR